MNYKHQYDEIKENETKLVMNQNLPTDPKEEKKQQKEPDGDQPMENLERTELTEEQKA